MRIALSSAGNETVTPDQVSREASARSTCPSGSSESVAAISPHGRPSTAAVRGPISRMNSSEVMVKRPSASICQTKRSGGRRSDARRSTATGGGAA